MPVSAKPRAILIDIVPPETSVNDAAYRLSEAKGLTDTYGGVIVVHQMQRRSHPDPRTYVGGGKVDELGKLMLENQAELLIVNGAVKPRQLFEIENQIRPVLKPRRFEVWDRVDLILKIFSLHAKTAEAKLQITMASIDHMGPRIYRMGMDLSQQGGGIGTRGAGETNTEMMKRHLAKLKGTIKKKLESYATNRDLRRARRQRDGRKTVSVVGYTNAGKSSLVRALTRKGTYVANELFATLDTSMAQLWLPGLGGEVTLSDTIGFIQDLPPQLVQAFRSTLDETVHADFLLHVIDAADPRWRDKIEVVDHILHDIHADTIGQILIANKMDLLPANQHTTIKAELTKFERERAESTNTTPRPIIFVSATSGDGLEVIKQQISYQFTKK